ncbi:MAG TPA: agmatinase [Phycisphaerales bacterium]|nr:agmatinase [Phycisphaerales bacterium]
MPTQLPNPRVSPRFAGIVTFGRYPRLEDVAAEHLPLDWVVYGVPFDSGVTYRPGARFGPRAMREASQYLKRFHIEHNVDVCEKLSMADAGDAPVKPYDLRENAMGVAEWATGLTPQSRGHTKLLALGGDHSIAYANIRATWVRQGSPKGGLALVHFDSHLDTVDAVWGNQWGHASPFIRAIEDGLIDPRRMLSIGIKGPLNSAGDLDYAKSKGIRIVTREDAARLGMHSGGGCEQMLGEFVRSLGGAPAYVTFDIDAVDPAFAPGTGTPSVGGFTSSEALALLRWLKGINIVGGDVVEVLPDRDPAGITSFLAAHVVFEMLALGAIGPSSRA